MILLPYDRKFRDACIAICASNVPEYFTESELSEFKNFIDSNTDPYYVLSCSEGIIGCGGIYKKSVNTAGLAWGIIHAKFHGIGAGKHLLALRLLEVHKCMPAIAVILNTSHITRAFYEKHGFRVSRLEKNGFGPNADKVVMIRNFHGIR